MCLLGIFHTFFKGSHFPKLSQMKGKKIIISGGWILTMVFNRWMGRGKGFFLILSPLQILLCPLYLSLQLPKLPERRDFRIHNRLWWRKRNRKVCFHNHQFSVVSSWVNGIIFGPVTFPPHLIFTVPGNRKWKFLPNSEITFLAFYKLYHSPHFRLSYSAHKTLSSFLVFWLKYHPTWKTVLWSLLLHNILVCLVNFF